MRTSVRHDDPGFEQYRRMQDDFVSGRAKILLNGTPVRRCITADEEQGFVIVIREDEDGRAMHDGEEVFTDTLRGKVEIVVP